MDQEFLKIAGAVAGIGGIAIASVVYVFREVIRKQIFPQLTKNQAYQLLNRMIVLTFVIGVLGIVAYLVVNWKSGERTLASNTQEKPASSPPPATAVLSGWVFDEHDKPIQGAQVTVDNSPGMTAVETSSDGIFNIKNIPTPYGKDVRVRVIAKGYSPHTEDFVLGAGPPRIKLKR